MRVKAVPLPGDSEYTLKNSNESSLNNAEGRNHPFAYLLSNHVTDLRQEVLTEELIELPFSKGGPLPKTLSDLSPFFFCLAQEPPSALTWPLGP